MEGWRGVAFFSSDNYSSHLSGVYFIGVVLNHECVTDWRCGSASLLYIYRILTAVFMG